MKKLLFLSLLFAQTLFALVSIAPTEVGDRPGLHGETELSLDTKKGNTDKENYKVSTTIVYDEAREWVLWSEIAVEYGESSNIKDTNNAYSHIRYIHTTEIKNLNYEYFAQMQNNEFKSIINRTLLGAGARYKLFSIFDNDKGYLGLGGFYEHIDYSTLDNSENQARYNIYFAYTITLDNKTKISYNLYYQPLIHDNNDYINTHAFELKTKIYENFSLKFKINYEKDSTPPIDVKVEDISQTTSLLYSF